MPDGALTMTDLAQLDARARVEAAIARIAAGGMVILTDDEDRENEGDLVVAADHATPEAIAFMATHGRGLVCCALAPQIVDRLELPLMVPPERNKSGFGTGFTVSVEAASGVSTGISAHDRARTIEVLIDPAARRADLATPGHMFPLRARPGGVLERPGQTEGSVDLARLAGLTPAGVICEVMNDDGAMARRPALEALAKRFDLPVVSVASLIAYRREIGDLAAPAAPVVRKAGIARLPTAHGDFEAHAYVDTAGREHLALVKVPLSPTGPVLARVHSECLTGDAFGSARCDCGGQLDKALARIAAEGGVLVYVRQEGRGIGLAEKIRAYALQDQGLDTYAANRALGHAEDARTYDAAAAILADLGVQRVRLMTNNPAKKAALEALGVNVVAREAHEAPGSPHAAPYLRAKAAAGGHLLADFGDA